LVLLTATLSGMALKLKVICNMQIKLYCSNQLQKYGSQIITNIKYKTKLKIT